MLRNSNLKTSLIWKRWLLPIKTWKHICRIGTCHNQKLLKNHDSCFEFERWRYNCSNYQLKTKCSKTVPFLILTRRWVGVEMPWWYKIQKGVVKQWKEALRRELLTDRVMAVYINPFTGSPPSSASWLWWWLQQWSMIPCMIWFQNGCFNVFGTYVMC